MERCDNSAPYRFPALGFRNTCNRHDARNGKQTVLHCLTGDLAGLEDKLCLGDHCYELAVGGRDPRLPDHGSAPAVQGVACQRVQRLWRGADELVLLSIVAVPLPSFRFASVPRAPSVSANAMMAPPCSTAGRVQSSPRTVISATILSAAALTISIPRSAANGSGISLSRCSRSMPDPVRAGNRQPSKV